MTRPSAILSPLQHRGQQHIKVEIANTPSARDAVRQVTGRKWSNTDQFWYVPCTSEAYKKWQGHVETCKPTKLQAAVKKNLSILALLHSYSTHDLAKGVDIELLRNLMGHESLKTTQIYLHVTKGRLLGTPSPFDDLDL